MKKSVFVAMAGLAAVALPALAGGGDIDIRLVGNNIITHKAAENGDPLGPSRVFVGKIALDSGVWYGDEPGLLITEGVLNPGDNLQLYFTKQLRRWDGSSFVLSNSVLSASFGPPSNSISTPGSDTNSSVMDFIVPPNNLLHDHPDWVLDSFAPAGGPEFFLVEARLRLAGYNDSESFWIVFGVNATEGEIEEIEEWVEANVVPAPSAALALAGFGLLASRRRRG